MKRENGSSSLSLSVITFYFSGNLKHFYAFSMASCTLYMCVSSFPCFAGHFVPAPEKLITKNNISVIIFFKSHQIK